MRLLKKHLLLLILITLGLAAFIRGIFFLDPDFGWHFKMGEYILAHGVPKLDLYSYTMPSYHFVDHEWFSDVLIAIGYRFFGMFGLAIFFALVFVAALWFVLPKQHKNYALFPLSLAGALMLGLAGVRPQVFTWLFFALLIKIILDTNYWRKWWLLIPFLFLLWANLHGGFAVGLAILGLFFVLRSFFNKRIEVKILVVLLVSALFTLVNPYGLGLWHEIWMVSSDNFSRWYIAEWAPGIFYVDIALCILFALSFFLFIRYRKLFNKTLVGILLLVLVMSLSAIRHIPLFALSMIPLITAGSLFLVKEVRKTNGGVKRLATVKKVLVVCGILVFSFEIYANLKSGNNFSQQNYYPVQAVNYLSKLDLKGNVFTTYNYGGYLIWKLPGKKVFIDGRMTFWRRNGSYPGESNYALKDYIKMIGDESYFKQMLKKYDIHYLLLATPQNTKKRDIPFLTKIENYSEKIVGGNTNFSLDNADLTKFGIKKIYSDKNFAIYEN